MSVNKYTRVIRAEDGRVIAEVYRDGVKIDNETFGLFECDFWVYMYGSAKRKRENMFQKARKWSADYLAQLKRYEEIRK